MFTNVKVVVIQMENIVAIKLKRWCGGGGERREGGGGSYNRVLSDLVK